MGWQKLFLVLLVIIMFVMNFGEAMAQKATKGEWWEALDSTFHWSDLNLRVERAPSNLSNLSLRRAFVLGLVPQGSSEAVLNELLLYRTVADNLSELFFPRFRGFTFLNEVKNKLLGFGVNLDSLEAVARGLPFGTFSATKDDTMSLSVLNAFAQKALESPVILLPSFDWTVGDTTATILQMANNRLEFAAYRTTIGSDRGFKLPQVVGLNGFTTFFESTFSFGTAFALGGLKTNGGISGSRISLAELTVVPKDSGNFSVFQDSALVVDTAGLKDRRAWPHKIVWGIFSRFDANQDFLVTIADAVFAARAILHGLSLPLLHLGDVNHNGLLDPDDPLIIFREAFAASLARISTPTTASVLATRGVIKVSGSENPNGSIVVKVSFEGDLGSSERFACRLRYDPAVIAVERTDFSLPAIAAISGSLVDSSANALNVLLYPEAIRTGDLFTVALKRIGPGDLKVELKPLVGDNFLSFSEEVRIEYAGLTGVNEGGVVPRSYELKQNYPNPFNPGTTIEYDLPKPGEVTLIVYNLLGEKVVTLVSGMKPAGKHSLRFEARELPSGIYFYRLQSDDFTKTKKMVLLH